MKRGVNAPEEEPARPQVLQSEFEDEIGQQHRRPHHHELQDGVGAAGRGSPIKTKNKKHPPVQVINVSAHTCVGQIFEPKLRSGQVRATGAYGGSIGDNESLVTTVNTEATAK